jgi:hypothetical protein
MVVGDYQPILNRIIQASASFDPGLRGDRWFGPTGLIPRTSKPAASNRHFRRCVALQCTNTPILANNFVEAASSRCFETVERAATASRDTAVQRIFAELTPKFSVR